MTATVIVVTLWSLLTSVSFYISSIFSLIGSEWHDLPPWLKYPIFNTLLSPSRDLIESLLDSLLKRFCLEVTLNDTDPYYGWMMVWITKKSNWNSARNFELCSNPAGVDNPMMMSTQSRPSPDEAAGGQDDVFFLPQPDTWYRFWYGWQPVSFTVRQLPASSSFTFNSRPTRRPRSLDVRIYTLRGKHILDSIAAEAKATYKAHNAERGPEPIWLLRPNDGYSDRWETTTQKVKRPLDSIILEQGRADDLVKDVKEFFGSAEWYRQRGIPYRRGYLLHGPPGTGKTSLVGAIAGELGLNIHCLSLSSKDLDDASIMRLMNKVPPKSIVLIEDIDAALPKRKGQAKRNRDSEGANDSGVTLAGLLNALDGIDSSDARVFFATTNHREALDPALCRPGRIDVNVAFRLASRHQIKGLFKKFYPTLPSTFVRRPSRLGTAISPNRVNMRFPSSNSADSTTILSRSQSELWSEEDERFREELLVESDSSGDDAPPTPETPTNTNGSSTPEPESDEPESTTKEIDAALELETLASTFANTIPEYTYSMATLQGYLLTYKHAPYEASNSDNIQKFMEEYKKDQEELQQSSSENEQIPREEPVPEPVEDSASSNGSESASSTVVDSDSVPALSPLSPAAVSSPGYAHGGGPWALPFVPFPRPMTGPRHPALHMYSRVPNTSTDQAPPAPPFPRPFRRLSTTFVGASDAETRSFLPRRSPDGSVYSESSMRTQFSPTRSEQGEEHQFTEADWEDELTEEVNGFANSFLGRAPFNDVQEPVVEIRPEEWDYRPFYSGTDPSEATLGFLSGHRLCDSPEPLGTSSTLEGVPESGNEEVEIAETMGSIRLPESPEIQEAILS